jgi:hypothetical protein
MVTRSARLDGFITDVAPLPDAVVELLCEDHVGTYLLPYPCRGTAEGFRNEYSGELIEAHVVGWRAPQERSSAFVSHSLYV